MTETVAADALVFTVKRSDKRRTIGITVDRGGALIMHVPKGTKRDVMKAFGEEKSFWVHTKLAEKGLFFRPAREREYVTGESFYYLGRNYRLLIVNVGSDAEEPTLKLHEGRFKLRRDQLDNAANHFRNWYITRGQRWLARRVEGLIKRIGASPRRIVVRDLGFRWGSCSRDGTLNVNWRTMSLPPSIIEYVVAHELIHLIRTRHNDEFWTRVERVIPDFKLRKRWLAEHGGRYV